MKHVVTFYRFSTLTDLDESREAIECQLSTINCVGTVLLAGEGVNATIAHSGKNQLESAVVAISKILGGLELQAKYSTAENNNPVFHRLKVRIRPEIIQLGLPFLGSESVGQHVDSESWNRLIDDPNVLVLDVRNDYEINVGSFSTATSLGIKHFRELPDAVARTIGDQVDTPIAMYCTGGIRCEKASHLLIERGYKQIYQLEGGILNYLDQVCQEDSKWEGDCFVFDQRVTVNANLEQGKYVQCFACRSALAESDTESEDYIEGVSCPHCFDEKSEEQRVRYAERMKQESLAKARGSKHIGSTQVGSRS